MSTIQSPYPVTASALNVLTTAGDILYENATPANARLAAGTVGQFLGLSGSPALPAWASTVTTPGYSVPNLGLAGLTIDPQLCISAQIASAGVVFWNRVTAENTVTVTTLGSFVTVAGVTAGADVNKMALYSTAGTRLGITGDMTTTFQSTGFREGALLAGVAVTAGTDYFLACTANFTATPLQWGVAQASIAVPALNSNFLGLFTSGNADLPASFTPGSASLNKSNICMYMR